MLTLDFKDTQALENRLVGGKGHGLSLMAQSDITVAPGFIVTTQAWRDYFQTTGLLGRIKQTLNAAGRDSFTALDECAARIDQWLGSTPLPPNLNEAIESSYCKLFEQVGQGKLSLAIRSSATAEDSAGTSFAGEFETFIGIENLSEVLAHVRRCWASAFSARALSYAWKNNIDPLSVEMAVVIQKRVQARASGVMFTISPISGDRSRLVIEAAWGLGLAVVGGEVTPDRFVVSKIKREVINREVGNKCVEYIDGHTSTAVDGERQKMLCLDDEQVLALAEIGMRLERLRQGAQDIEFAIDAQLPQGKNIVMLQCRPITVLNNSTSGNKPNAKSDALADIANFVLKAARG